MRASAGGRTARLFEVRSRKDSSSPARPGPARPRPGPHRRYVAAAERSTPAALDELRGIAEGACVPFDSILEHNLADERRVFAGAGRCSSVGLTCDANRLPVSGQTMDTPAWFARTRVAVRSVETETGLTTLAFTIAGIPALCGVNSAGVSVWCNALYQLPSSPHGVPVSCIVRHLLSSPSLAASKESILALPHASGQHYLLGGPEGLSSLECSAGSVTELPFRGDAVWHTNHPLASRDRAGGAEGESSLARGSFLAAAVAAAVSEGDLRAALGDRTVPVCKTGEGGGDGYTLWAALAVHSVPPQVAATAGPPSEAPWVRVGLDAPMFRGDRSISGTARGAP